MEFLGPDESGPVFLHHLIDDPPESLERRILPIRLGVIDLTAVLDPGYSSRDVSMVASKVGLAYRF